MRVGFGETSRDGPRGLALNNTSLGPEDGELAMKSCDYADQLRRLRIDAEGNVVAPGV